MKRLRTLLLSAGLRHSAVGLIIVGILFLPFLSLGQAEAATCNWSGGAADNNWSDKNNWTCGGVAGSAVPGASDTAVFSSGTGFSTKNATVDASFAGTVASITINSGYTGTISLSQNLAATSSYSQAGGTFNVNSQTLSLGTFSQTGGTFNGGSQSVSMSSFTLSAGSYTASSGTTSISGAMTISGSPTFTNNSGTVNFNGSTTASLSCNSVTFSKVTFTNTAGTKTVSSNCSMPLGTNPNATSGGNITNNGTLSGSGTLTTTGGTLILGSGSALSGFSGLVTDALTINGDYSNTFGSYTTFTVNAAFTVNSGGKFTAPSGTASFATGFTINTGATFGNNNGTINFNGTTGTISCASGVTFNKVNITNPSGTKTISSGCTLPLGSNPNANSGGNLVLNGTLSGSGTLTTAGGGTLTLGSTGALSGFSGLSTTTLTISGGTYPFGSYTTFTVGGTFTLSSGTFTAPSGTASFAGAFTISSGATFNANGGTVNFNGVAASIACGSATFNLVTFTHTAGIKTVGSDCNPLPLGNNPVIGSSGSAGLKLDGSLSGSGTITFGGTGSLTLDSTGSLSGFSGLSANALTVNGTYNFGSYSTFSVGSTFTINSGGNLTAPSGTASFTSTTTINSGGTFNANSGSATFTGAVTINSGGTFNASGAKPSLGGTFTVNSGGSVNFNSANASFGGAYAVSNSATFTATSSTFTFNGANQTLSCGGQTLSLVVLAGSGTVTVGNDCNLPLGNNPGVYPLSITLNGALSGSGTLTTTNLTIGSTSPGLDAFTNVTVVGAFNLNSGAILKAPSGTLIVNGNFTISSGATFNANGGTVSFQAQPSTTKTVDCGSTSTVFNLVTIANSAPEVFNSDCNLPLGANPTVGYGGSVTVNGTLTGSGTLTASAGTLTLNSSTPLSGFSGFTGNGPLVVSGGTADFSGYTTFNENNAFTLSGGTFIAPPGTASFSNSFTINSGSSFTNSGGTVNFNGTGGGTISCNSQVFHLVTFTHSGNNKNISSSCTLPLGNNPVIGSGAFGGINLSGTLTGSGTLKTATSASLILSSGYQLIGFSTLNPYGLAINSGTADLSGYANITVTSNILISSGANLIAPGTLYVGGFFTNSGTFTANGGTVVLNGSGQTLTGNITFYNLSKTVTSGDTLTFAAGSTTTVLGKLTLQGASASNLLALVSSAPGSPWYIDAAGTTNVDYVDVADSDASVGPVIVTCDSVDSGGNSGWSFNPSTCSPEHGSTATTAVTNYELLQAALIIQNSQSQSQSASYPNLPGNTGLPSKIFNFVNQFPGGKALLAAAGQFLKALVAGVVLGIAIGLWLVWRHRRLLAADEANEYLTQEPVEEATKKKRPAK